MDTEHAFRILLLSSSVASVLAYAGRFCSIHSIYRQGPQPLGPVQPLCVRYYHTFLSTVSCYAILSVVTVSMFGVLAFVQGEPWHMYVSGSIVLLSMTGQVRFLQFASFPLVDDTSLVGLAASGILNSRLSIQSS
jgi:hypothetical protein